MRKLLTVLGACFLFLLVAGGGMLGYAAFQGPRLDAEGRAYVDATLPQVLSHPTADNFLSFVASQDKANFSSVAIEGFASYLESNLGAFQSCEEPKGQATMMFTPSGANVTARYLARCHFSKASITTQVSLRKTEDVWSLVGVFFDGGSRERASPSASSL